MRIISKFKDFYDGAQGYGYDPKLVYVRDPQVLWDGRDTRHKVAHKNWNPRPKYLDPLYRQSTYKANSYGRSHMPEFGATISNGVIAFCGRLYPFYKLACGTYAYNFNQVYKTIAENDYYIHSTVYNKKNLLNSLETGKTLSRYIKWGAESLTKESWDKWYSGLDTGIGDELHVEAKSPIISLINNSYDGLITANDRLNQYEFAKVVDPFTAYQELSMYVGNNLVEQKDPNPYISDELKAESHGFDKWSFRTLPTKKR